MITLTDLDRQLLSALREDGRASVASLARQLGVARATVNTGWTGFSPPEPSWDSPRGSGMKWIRSPSALSPSSRWRAGPPTK
ncbi:Lrp/AsnC family transcriptional regulator [Pseudarthrobacter sp. WHRI 8279]|uniref:Lrp/AsnC family transcriptional regulator n=1 Tax=Pseudarthrobacter sp. WHRI 8279 TaxID=3162566 RepID=UPI0035A93126